MLSDALVSIARGVMPNVPVHEGQGPAVRPADQSKAIEMLLDRGFGRSPQQLNIAHSVSETKKPLRLRGLWDSLSSLDFQMAISR